MIATVIAVLSAATLVTSATPFTLDARVPIGISLEKKAFITIEEVQKNKETTVHIRGYKPPRGVRFKVPLRSFAIDKTDEETERATQADAKAFQAKANTWFETHNIQAMSSLAGGLTGRFRLLDQGLVIAQKENQLVVRRGDASVMKSKVLIKSLSGVVKRCRGTAKGKVKHVVFVREWKAIAVYVEATCQPNSDKRPYRRASRLFVYDLAKLSGK